MSTENDGRPALAAKLWRRNGLIWVALMFLLLLTLALAYVPMGPLSPATGVGIAAIKAVLVVLLFMELNNAMPLIRLAPLSGLFFLAALFLLTLADVLSRLA